MLLHIQRTSADDSSAANIKDGRLSLSIPVQFISIVLKISMTEGTSIRIERISLVLGEECRLQLFSCASSDSPLPLHESANESSV